MSCERNLCTSAHKYRGPCKFTHVHVDRASVTPVLHWCIQLEQSKSYYAEKRNNKIRERIKLIKQSLRCKDADQQSDDVTMLGVMFNVASQETLL